jgi:hypothetical protein
VTIQVVDATAACPYCLSDIPSQALVCRHCSRDVSLFRTLLDEIDRLKNENLTQKNSLEAFQNLHGGSLLEVVPAQQETAPSPRLQRAWPLWGAGVLTVLTLGCLHWLLFFVYDTPVVVFRIVTFCVPVALGFWAGSQSRYFWLYQVCIAMLTGIASVFVMLSITHQIDQVPLWPQDFREWRETVEYLLSIALALLTGFWAWSASARWKRTRPNGGTLFLLQRDEKGRLKLEQLSSDVQLLIATLAPFVSGVMAVYAAVKSFLS